MEDPIIYREHLTNQFVQIQQLSKEVMYAHCMSAINVIKLQREKTWKV